MRLLRPFACLLLLLFAFPLFASDSYEQALASALVNRVLILRNYYTDAKLAFDANGALTSKGTPGFGPGEGRIYVTKVQLGPDKLILSGLRLLDVFDSGSQQWQIAPTATTVSVQLFMPANEDPKVAVPHLINTVFLKKSEVAEAECSAKEKQEFLEDTSNRINHPNTKSTTKLPDAASLGELHPYCLPGGDRVYRVGRWVKPPHARDAPDPQYTQAARYAGLQGTTILLAVITSEGVPTAISIQRSLGAGLSDKVRPLGHQLDQRAVEAVSQWKFDPATFQGKPVPVVINVEVNFKLY